MIPTASESIFDTATGTPLMLSREKMLRNGDFLSNHRLFGKKQGEILFGVVNHANPKFLKEPDISKLTFLYSTDRSLMWEFYKLYCIP